MTTNMKESGFEDDFTQFLIEQQGYKRGQPGDYHKTRAMDETVLLGFLMATQAKKLEQLGATSAGTAQTRMLDRIRQSIDRRGIIDVLLNGVSDQNEHLDLYYKIPSALNQTAVANHAANILSVTQQVRYSQQHPGNAVDMVIFVNGLPLLTFELKNTPTGRTVHNAIKQYQLDRSPKNPLFRPGSCAAHFAMDEQQIAFCSRLSGENSWFLPFNKGFDGGAGNPPNPNGYMVSYLWEEILAPSSLFDIIEHYARRVEELDRRTNRKTIKDIWPRYHQLQAVRSMLAHAHHHSAGQRYLIQHSAGSGKSYSITWLAHQLTSLRQRDSQEPVFHAIFVVTDRRVLDRQIRNEIKRFGTVSAIIGAVTEGSAQLRQFIEQGKRIITSTIQKFPFILDELGNSHRHKRFAIIIDEAHSSQGGRTASAMNRALGNVEQTDEDLSYEDKLLHIMQGRQMLSNASYFAFTATPKNKTEELFGTKATDGSYHPFHSYTMKQAIEEGFIRDVLKHYTTVKSYYSLVKTVSDDPEFDSKKAQKKLRNFVEGHEQTILQKAEIMLDHFFKRVYQPRRVDGKARAMVVCNGVDRALEYKRTMDQLIESKHMPFKTLVAFSGERDFGGTKVTEDTLNGFPGNDIPQKLREDPYRLLIVADKYQTGFDEPLLQTMYVDKPLSDVKAVQTLSRLNRAHPKKHDVFVLDFANEAKTIHESFSRYYRTTTLSEGTDPNKLHDLQYELDGHQVYTHAHVEDVVRLFFEGAPRAQIEGILGACVHHYTHHLDEEEQVSFKGKAKAFCRTYNFLSAVITFHKKDWEQLSIFLNFLLPKLPAPKEDDRSKGILETIDLESYRNEIQAEQHIRLDEDSGQLDPVPISSGSSLTKQQELDLSRVSHIVRSFNDLFGGEVEHLEQTRQEIIDEVVPMLVQSQSVQLAVKQGDPVKIQHAVEKEITKSLNTSLTTRTENLKDHISIFRGFSNDPQKKRCIIELLRTHMPSHYEIAILSHEGWQDYTDLLEEPWHELAVELQQRGISPPHDYHMDLPGSPQQSVMTWLGAQNQYIALVANELKTTPPNTTAILIGDPPDYDALAETIKKHL